MAGEQESNLELQQLWTEYEEAMWAGLGAVKNQESITAEDLEQLSAAQRRALRTLGRLRELIDG